MQEVWRLLQCMGSVLEEAPISPSGGRLWALKRSDCSQVSEWVFEADRPLIVDAHLDVTARGSSV